MSKRRKYILSTLAIGVLIFFFLPVVKFNVTYSTVLSDRNNHLLAAHIAEDEQWRFPPADSVPEKFRIAIIHFEDEYFKYHPGVNPISLSKALIRNVKQGKIVSGGSTITMQVIRLANPAPRTIANKIKEIILAIRMEASLSKDSILALYAAHAPFGGNTVGLEAASYRYFNRPSHELTWAETATLAVLPNSPSLVHLGRSTDTLRQKRDRLLNKLFNKGLISETELQLALLEELPEQPGPMPNLCPHLLDYHIIRHRGKHIQLSIDSELQHLASLIVERHSKALQNNEIYNAAAIIASVETGEVLAYVGNSNGTQKDKGYKVDIIRSSRSSGSVLKPFLYAVSLQDGLILPTSLLPDIPTYYKNYIPRNYSKSYDGAVHADRALARSLNIPFVRLLNDYDGNRFVSDLTKLGFTTINKPYSHYGLSLILGGSEVTLWDLAGSFASMRRTLNQYIEHDGMYPTSSFHPLRLQQSKPQAGKELFTNTPPVLGASAIYFTLKALTSVERPPEESGWEHFGSSGQIAWKTGTSFGYRDAWGVGVSSDFVVAVWVGNASGEGRPGIIGGSAAGPILFELFSLLPSNSALPIPHDDLDEVMVCPQSGERAGPYCTDAVARLVPKTIKKSHPCSYHKLVHLSPDGRYRSNLEIEDGALLITKSYFILPPVIEWYYRKINPSYQILPPFKPGFESSDDYNGMELIYPPHNTTVLIPRDLNGNLSRMVIKAVHRREDETIYWHLNGKYLGSTTGIHEIEILPERGIQRLSLVDSRGKRIQRSFICADDLTGKEKTIN